METSKEKNKELIEKFPFLLPRNVWTDKVDEDYDYSYTILDEMPDGWRIAFGEIFCEELKEELVKFNFLEDYRVVQVKEKYGQLRWYDNGYPANSDIGDIIDKYSRLSENICIICGKPDVPMCGEYWISPFCKDCYLKDDRNTEEEWNGYNKTHPNKMCNCLKYHTSRGAEPGKWQEVVIDVSETAEKIRIDYRRRIAGEKS